jgi:hypothetical protein
MGWGDGPGRAMLEALLRHHPEVLERWDAEIRKGEGHGGDRKSEEFKEKIKSSIITHDHVPSRGTRLAYTLDRLKRDHPDLAKEGVDFDDEAKAGENKQHGERPPLAEWGEIGGGHGRGDIITSDRRGTSAVYQPKRDFPEIAQ